MCGPPSSVASPAALGDSCTLPVGTPSVPCGDDGKVYRGVCGSAPSPYPGVPPSPPKCYPTCEPSAPSCAPGTSCSPLAQPSDFVCR
jgi:hypothetical protein